MMDSKHSRSLAITSKFIIIVRYSGQPAETWSVVITVSKCHDTLQGVLVLAQKGACKDICLPAMLINI